MKYNQKDMSLLSEAYAVTLLREQAPHMTIKDVLNKLPYMTESELKYINTVSDRILEEAFNFGGLKNVAGAVGRGLSSAAQTAKTAAQGAGRAIADTAANVGRGVAGAASQVGQNVKDMYQTGNLQAQQSQSLTSAQKSVEDLVKALEQADAAGLLGRKRGEWQNLSLNQIIKRLQGAADMSSQQAQDAQAKGFTGGMGQAFKQGYQGA